MDNAYFNYGIEQVECIVKWKQELIDLLMLGSPQASQVANNTLRSPKLSSTPDGSHLRQPISGEESRYLELLAQLYVYRRQHALAAHVLLRLAERRQIEGAPEITLEQRYIDHTLH